MARSFVDTVIRLSSPWRWLLAYYARRRSKKRERIIHELLNSWDYRFIGDRSLAAFLGIWLCGLLCCTGPIDRMTLYVATVSATNLRCIGRYNCAESLLRCIVNYDAKMFEEDPLSLVFRERHAAACLYIDERVEQGIRKFSRLSREYWASGEYRACFTWLKWCGFGLLQLGRLDDAWWFHLKLLRHLLSTNCRWNLADILVPAEGATNCLVSIMIQRGDHLRAEPLCQLVLKRRQNSVGLEHNDTLHSHFHLANIAERRGNIQRAREIYYLIYERAKKGLGIKHHLTTTCLQKYDELGRNLWVITTSDLFIFFASAACAWYFQLWLV
ncbi:hypothetical protein IWW34DRAFT_764967 [Fusarium oxysporum f. sp. albedinis]|nr:hypothetical protein IWW34DRAFT_764967 [Fusarium oxysporum f. sp. albedinis]